MVADVKTTAMTVYERIPDPVNAIQLMGNDIAKSGLFNCGSVEQGRVLALECFARGVPPLTLAETYHIIDNKLSMKADKMLARFEEFGGKYKVVSRTPDLAAIEVTIGGQTNKFSLSWEEAQQEPFVYVGSEKAAVESLASGQKPKFKTKYATPRSRTQMLWARVVSDSVRAVCPRANSGTYTPEEIDDFQGAEARSNVNGHAKPTTASVVDQAAAAAAENGALAGTEAGEVVDAEFEVKADPPAATATATATPPRTSDSPELATEYQIARIRELSIALACGEKVESACKKRGCNSVRSLRKEDAGEMLDKLEANFAAKKAAEPAASTEQSAEPPAEMPPCGPMTDRQYEAINKAMGEFAQIDPAGKQQFYENLKAWLASKGLKLRQIDATQAAQLCDSIRQKSLPTFIRMDLEKHAGN